MKYSHSFTCCGKVQSDFYCILLVQCVILRTTFTQKLEFGQYVISQPLDKWEDVYKIIIEVFLLQLTASKKFEYAEERFVVISPYKLLSL